MGRVASCDNGLDAAGSDLPPIGVVVIATVREQDAGPLAWTADLARDGRDTVQQREQLRDVVAIPAGQGERQWQAAGVGQEVML
jgi:hypothetical protein